MPNNKRKKTAREKRLISRGSYLTLAMNKKGFPNWSKRDFIRNQAAHEGVKMPSRHNHIESFRLLAAFAMRNRLDLECRPSKTKSPAKPKAAKIPIIDYKSSDIFTPWRKVRYQALKRSKGCCECCGAVAGAGNPLHVDHIKPKSLYPELGLELSNLQVLCAECNIGKGNWDETDWRDESATTH